MTRKQWEGWTRPGLKEDDELFYHQGHMWDIDSLKEMIDALDQLEEGIAYLQRMNAHKSR
jgi:hypothetical protein